MRARLAIKASGQSLELREVRLADKPQALLDCSAKATVPVLVLPDNTVLDESRDILMWALGLHDPHNWLPQDQQQLTNMTALIDENDGDFKQHLDHYKYADRFPQQSMTVYRQQAEGFIASLDRQLQEGGFLCGDQCSLADIAIFPFVRQFAHVDKSWFDQTGYSRLQVWLAHFLNSPLFLSVMEKYPPWQPGQKALIF